VVHASAELRLLTAAVGQAAHCQFPLSTAGYAIWLYHRFTLNFKDLGWYETPNQTRSACGRQADRLLVWALSPDDLWIAEEEDEAYQVEADPPEDSTAA